MNVLVTYRDRLDNLAAKLIAEETIEGVEFEKALRRPAQPAQRRPSTPRPLPAGTGAVLVRAGGDEAAQGKTPAPAPSPA